jgi:hypothetical protein
MEMGCQLHVPAALHPVKALVPEMWAFILKEKNIGLVQMFKNKGFRKYFDVRRKKEVYMSEFYTG